MILPAFISFADRQLLDTEFSLSSLSGLKNLLDDIPTTATTVRVLARYDVSGTQAEKVRCAVCHAARHHRGFHVETEFGEALLGRDCGRNRFKLDWDKEEHRFETAVARKAALERMLDAVPLVEEMLALEHEMVDGAERQAGFVTLLRSQHGKLSQAIARAVRDHGGALQYPVKVRDREAEEARARSIVPWLVQDLEEAKGTISRNSARRSLDRWIEVNAVTERTEFRTAGILRGGHCLFSDNLVGRLKAAIALLRGLASQLEIGPVDPSTFVDRVRTAGHVFEEVAELNKHLDEFTGRPNRQIIADWSTKVGVAARIPLVDPWASSSEPVVGRLWEAVGRA